MRGGKSVLDWVQLLYYKYHKLNPHRGGSCIDSSEWINSKKATTNPINKKGNKYFQYTITVALNHDKITGKPKRITKIKLFISIYNWEEINYTLKKYDEDHIILQ